MTENHTPASRPVREALRALLEIEDASQSGVAAMIDGDGLADPLAATLAALDAWEPHHKDQASTREQIPHRRVVLRARRYVDGIRLLEGATVTMTEELEHLTVVVVVEADFENDTGLDGQMDAVSALYVSMLRTFTLERVDVDQVVIVLLAPEPGTSLTTMTDAVGQRVAVGDRVVVAYSEDFEMEVRVAQVHAVSVDESDYRSAVLRIDGSTLTAGPQRIVRLDA